MASHPSHAALDPLARALHGEDPPQTPRVPNDLSQPTITSTSNQSDGLVGAPLRRPQPSFSAPRVDISQANPFDSESLQTTQPPPPSPPAARSSSSPSPSSYDTAPEEASPSPVASPRANSSTLPRASLIEIPRLPRLTQPEAPKLVSTNAQSPPMPPAPSIHHHAPTRHSLQLSSMSKKARHRYRKQREEIARAQRVAQASQPPSSWQNFCSPTNAFSRGQGSSALGSTADSICAPPSQDGSNHAQPSASTTVRSSPSPSSSHEPGPEAASSRPIVSPRTRHHLPPKPIDIRDACEDYPSSIQAHSRWSARTPLGFSRNQQPVARSMSMRPSWGSSRSRWESGWPLAARHAPQSNEEQGANMAQRKRPAAGKTGGGGKRLRGEGTLGEPFVVESDEDENGVGGWNGRGGGFQGAPGPWHDHTRFGRIKKEDSTSHGFFSSHF